MTIPWSEPHRLRVDGQAPEDVEVTTSGVRVTWTDDKGKARITWYSMCGCRQLNRGEVVKLTVIDEPAAPAFDPGKPFEYLDREGGWWRTGDPVIYDGAMVDGRHVVHEFGGPAQIAAAVRNIAQPEPAHVEGPEVVAFVVIRSDGVIRSLLVAYDKTKTELCKGDTVRPLTFADTAKPKGKSLGWVNVYRDKSIGGVHSTREVADSCHHHAPRLACVEIFEGDGL